MIGSLWIGFRIFFAWNILLLKKPIRICISNISKIGLVSSIGLGAPWITTCITNYTVLFFVCVCIFWEIAPKLNLFKSLTFSIRDRRCFSCFITFDCEFDFLVCFGAESFFNVAFVSTRSIFIFCWVTLRSFRTPFISFTGRLSNRDAHNYYLIFNKIVTCVSMSIISFKFFPLIWCCFINTNWNFFIVKIHQTKLNNVVDRHTFSVTYINEPWSFSSKLPVILNKNN